MEAFQVSYWFLGDLIFFKTAIVTNKVYFRFGRRPTVLIGGVIEGGTFILSGLVPNYEMFAVLRCVMGFFSLWVGTTILVTGKTEI